ncbi:MAG TPA: ABC transporter permease [Gammaproteobacteria bacterium]|nr:ABC transporter permease [Gammaproteobacteria bacterium]
MQEGFWRRLSALTKKEVRQLLRDRGNLAIGLLLPVVLILIFGYGLTFDVRNAPVAVVLEDRSPTANDVIAGLRLSPYLSPIILPSMRVAEELMLRREVDAIVYLTADFSRQLYAGNGRIQILLHGTDANYARTIQAYVEGALGEWAVGRVDRSAGKGRPLPGSVGIEQRLWFNSANTSTWFLVPGLIVLIMTLVGAFLTALVMAREWERGTLEALFVTPVRPTEILLAKVLPYFGVGMIGWSMCLLAAIFLFKVPLYGSFSVLLLSSVLYLLVAVGIGLVISSATKSQFLASQLALVLSFMPALMLSGFIFDLRNVPPVVRAVGKVLPATYYMDLLKSLFLAGDVWPLILHNCSVLAVYAMALLGLARVMTRKRVA